MKKLNLQWVSNVIGDDYKNWSGNDIILLQAQTGTGKTWFIKNVLVKNIDKEKRFLLVCNRINLKRQLKADLLKIYNKDIPEKVEDIDQISTINNITITSYQQLQKMIEKHEYYGSHLDLEYDYVIMDEAHYILTDSSFNNTCRLAYEYLISRCILTSVIKIFISATMEEIEEPILDSISHVEIFTPNIIRYCTGTDYSYVNPIYYKNDLEIITNLIKNDKLDEKWIIFVTNKNDGNKIHDALGDKISSFISTDNSNHLEVKNIISYSKFNKKVLITTKVLDNGINIDDDKLINIVIMAWDRVTFIQELGRKRIDINNPQQVNLYIPTRYKKSFLRKAKLCEDQLLEVKLFKENRIAFNKKYDNDTKKISKLNHLFYNNNGWELNKVGEKRINIDLQFFQHMQSLFDCDKDYAFVHKQLEWLGLDNTFNPNKLIESVILMEKKQTLENYLDSIVGKKLFKEDQQELKFIAEQNGLQTKTLGIHTINGYIKDVSLPYIIESKRGSKRTGQKMESYRYWKVYKLIDNL